MLNLKNYFNMSNSCVYVPEKGQSLFKKLRQNFNYETSKNIFLTSISPSFQQVYRNALIFDDEGIPTYESLMANKVIQDIIEIHPLKEKLNKGSVHIENTYDNYNYLIEEASNFNNKSELGTKVTALVKKEGKSIYIEYVDKNHSNLQEAKKQYSIHLINKKILGTMKGLGMSIEMLDDFEKGQNGKIDFSKAKEAANGVITMISIANDSEGVRALSEEFSHLLVRVFRDEELLKRLIKSLSKEELLQKILGEEYSEVIDFYTKQKELDSSVDVLALAAEEALGKILQQKLIDKATIETPSISESLFARFVNFLKNKFKGRDTLPLEEAIQEANAIMETVADYYLKDHFKLTREDVLNTKSQVTFRSVDAKIKQLEKTRELLNKVVANEIKRHKIQGNMESLVANVSGLSYAAREDIEEAQTYRTLIMYAGQAVRDLRKVLQDIRDIDLDGADLLKTFQILRKVKLYQDSYAEFTQEFSKIYLMDKESGIGAFEGKYNIQPISSYTEETISVPTIISLLNNINEEINILFTKHSRQKFASLLVNYSPQIRDNASLDDEAKVAALEKLLEESTDISFTDKWMDSLVETSDPILQAVGLLLHKQQTEAKNNFNDLSKQVLQWMQDAEKAGITDFEWMFERDKDGNKTGYYIRERNEYQFLKDREEFLKELNKNIPNKSTERSSVMKDWFVTQKRGTSLSHRATAGEYYINKDYVNLPKEKKDLLERYLKIKSYADAIYGNTTSDVKGNVFADPLAIQLRKSGDQRFMEAFKTSPTSAWQNLKNSIEEKFLVQIDDVEEEGIVKNTMVDFAGNEYLRIPKLYTSALENPNEVSTEVVTALMRHLYAACMYEKIEPISHPLEIGRHVLAARETIATVGNSPLREKIQGAGMTAIKEVLKNSTSNFLEKYNSFINAQVYRRYLKEVGTFELPSGKVISGSKTVSAIMQYASYCTMGFNFLSNLANIMTGKCMQRIEAVGGKYFKYADLVKADGIFFNPANFIGFIKDATNRIPENKLWLFLDYFDIKQDMDSRSKKDYKKSAALRLLGPNIAFLGQEMGDYWLYMRTALAMANKTKVKVNGQECSFWDALEVVNALGNDSSIKTLKLKPGTTTLDGREIKDKDSFCFELGEKIKDRNRDLFGSYNIEDANMANTIVMGKLLMHYRRWLKPQLNVRFKRSQQNYITGEMEEGYYTTLLKLTKSIVADLKFGKVTIAAHWRELEESQKRNIFKCVFEVTQFYVISSIIPLIFDFDDDDDKNKFEEFAYYYTQRLKHELGALTPFSGVFFKEHSKNFKTPLPIMSTVDNLGNFIGSVFTPADWNNKLQSGPYEGQSTLYKNFMKAPIPPVSILRNLDKGWNQLEESAQYYIKSY